MDWEKGAAWALGAPGGRRKWVAREIVARSVTGVSRILPVALAWLEPLRAYPRWLVLLCVAVVLGGLLAVAARPLKWALYAGLAGLLAVLMAGFAWWLEG